MTVELDDKFVKIEDYKNGDIALNKKLEVQNDKFKKIKAEIEKKNKDFEWKLDEKLPLKEFKD